ncbi:hypothetical protein Q5P01_005307 [Channa striata]|uniref:TNFR-Cys domain-containing protein n=1 Tax=Channa striata TaxID=64152 RepID=A0AA88T772_CHASR|nr:hypothetical protein Q5P01_005307 [Channa striata]
MPVMRVSAVLLYAVVVDISARVLTTTRPADQPSLSSHQYQHTDPNTGVQVLCNKCPAGTSVSVHCSHKAERECSPCPEGTFTRSENGVQQCHQCRAPCPAGLIEKAPCTATQDRVCTCPPNSFFSTKSGKRCKPHSLCPPGTRVKKRGTEIEDVLCKPCTKGTFSDVELSGTKCRTHTNCEAQGLVLLTPGTRVTDNVCGPPPTTLSSSSSLSISSTNSVGLAQAVLVKEPVTSLSSLLSTLTGPALEGPYSQSAAIQLKGKPEMESHSPKRPLLIQLDTPMPWTPAPPARTQLKIVTNSSHNLIQTLC